MYTILACKIQSCDSEQNAGDTVQRLLWRMRNGELPKRNHPRVVVLLIGSNDLTSPDCASPGAANRTAAELRGLLVYIHR